MALPGDILTTIKQLEKRVRNLETTPQPPNIVKTGFSTGSDTLAADSHQTYRIRLQVPSGALLLAIPELTIYRNSVSADNRYPFAPGWTYVEALNFHIHWWFDESSTTGNELRFFLNLINQNATTVDVAWRVRFRYLMSGATTTVT